MKALWRQRWIAALVVGVFVLTATAEAGVLAQRRAERYYPRSVAYYDPAWGSAPHALIVPPQVRRQVEYQQGVGGVMHQWLPEGYPTEVLRGGPFQSMNAQPWSTNHMGTYYLRGPR